MCLVTLPQVHVSASVSVGANLSHQTLSQNPLSLFLCLMMSRLILPQLIGHRLFIDR